MLCSMTGYGSGDEGGRFSVEIRTVNNRYLDVQIRMPRAYASLEPRVKKTVQEMILRGRCDVFISEAAESSRHSRFGLDAEVARQYVDLLKDLKTSLDLPGEVDLSLIAGFPDIVAKSSPAVDQEAAWESLGPPLNAALRALLDMRRAEGAALISDIRTRLQRIRNGVETVRKLAPRTVDAARVRMSEAVRRLTGEGLDPARLAQEVALLADRTDVAEEITRLASHLVQFDRLLNAGSGDAMGRKIDFLLQEIGREANTIASKAMDSDIALAVVDIKAELERIREQVQNIE